MTISYELAKQLKESGFPQKEGEPYSYILPDNSRVFWADTLSDDDGRYAEKCYVPTLSELIVACGEGFYVLSVERTLSITWWASDKLGGSICKGETPEEAVARLYLKIHG